MINKTLFLTSLSLVPLATNPAVASISNTTNSTIVVEESNVAEEPEACSMMYVGKDVSTNGQAYIARSSDAGPTGMDLNCQIFEPNHWAGQTIYGKNGFEYKMPDTTYRYISTPRNPKMNKGLHWEVSGINEKGVAVTATLSCQTNDLALAAEPLETTKGITEDNITQIVAATSSSAREGVKTICDILDDKGSGEMNAIMIMDKDEAWYMEMYTGHQYAAIKMPEDKICTIGNEFMLETLDEYSEIITSPKLFTLPKNKGFLSPATATSVKDMNLFYTYGGEKDPGVFIDSCHMRTWIGHYLFAYNNEPEYHKYETQAKYRPFYKPDNKLSYQDILTYMRDRYETILDHEEDVNYSYFKDLYDKNQLRYVGDALAYQIHAITINPNLPAETSVQEWICFSNSNHSPFVPISNGITKMHDYYTHVTPEYSFDQESAVCIYKRLNALVEHNRNAFGRIIQKYIEEHERAWAIQYDDVISQIKDLSISKQQEVLTNFCYDIQVQALTMSNVLYEDLLWHIINKTRSYHPSEIDWTFYPLVNIPYYSWLYGWNYKRDDKIVTLTQDNDTITIDLNYTWSKYGKISKNGGPLYDLAVSIRDDVPYMDYEWAREYIAKAHDVAKIDINDYMNGLNPLVWILPVAIGVPLVAAAITIPLVIHNKNKKKHLNKKK